MLAFLMRRRTVFLLCVVLLAALGVGLALNLPIQLYPQTQRPRVFVRLGHSGYSAVDFADRYGQDVEGRLLALDGVDSLTVEYRADQSSFTVTFDWNTDPDAARADVESAMTAVRSRLPADIRDDYSVRFFAGENAGFLLLGVRSPGTSTAALHAMLVREVEPQLARVTDAESVEINNVEDLDVDVTLRHEAMLDYGLTIDDVDAAFRAGYRPQPVGSLEENDREFTVRYHRGVDSLFDIGQIVIADRGSVRVRLSDIADITIRYSLPSSALVIDGEPAVRVNATPRDGGNIRQMSQDVIAILEEAIAGGALPADTRLQLYVDPADYINRSILNVGRAAAIGAALAVIIVLLTLGELRNTILIAISLPLTLSLAFILMAAFGVSLNLISLGGIALAVGMVIDSSIVVMENIHRHYEESDAVPDRQRVRSLILTSVAEVRAPVIASTVTTILVFLPIAFTAPLANAILGDQARTVIFALVAALGVALTVIPVVAADVYRPHPAGGARPARGLGRLSAGAMGALTRAYRVSLHRAINRRGGAVATVVLAFVLLTATVVTLLPRIPREIISPPSSDRIVVFFRSNRTTDRLTIVEEVVPRLEATVRERSGDAVEKVYALVSGRFNILFINVVSTERAPDVLAEVQQALVSDNEFYYNASMWDPAELPLPRTTDLQISLRGPDERELVLLLEQLRDLVNESEFYGRVFTDPQTGLSDELAVTVRQEVVDGFPGMTADSIIATLQRILRGTSAIDFDVDSGTVQVAAAYPEAAIGSRDAIADFLLTTSRGEVPLKHLLDFREEQGVAGIASEDGEPIFRAYALLPRGSSDVARRDAEAAIREVVAERLALPPQVTLTFDNPRTELDEAIASLVVALGASLVLIYLVVAFQFNSLWIPLVILVTVPLGFIGVVVSLVVFDSTLSLNSMLGTILLGGIVVNNAILMIDFYRRTGARSRSHVEAVVDAARLRFAPIVITMLTTILGMLPIAIGLGEGSNIVQPLGIAVSGGLLVSTLFTLYVVPAILRLARR